MIHTICLLSPAQCLFRTLSSRTTSFAPLRIAWSRTYLDARRIASPQSLVQVDRLASFVRDDQIGSGMVRVKDNEGQLGEPQSSQGLLRNLDRRTHTVVQLSKPGDGGEPAIVRIYEKTELLKEVREKEQRARQQQLAAKEKKPKQIELNWAISENDLELKMKQMETFLEKGKKVEILLASRKRQRKASLEEGSSVLKKVRDRIEEIGAKEIKSMEGQILKQATLTVKK